MKFCIFIALAGFLMPQVFAEESQNLLEQVADGKVFLTQLSNNLFRKSSMRPYKLNKLSHRNKPHRTKALKYNPKSRMTQKRNKKLMQLKLPLIIPIMQHNKQNLKMYNKNNRPKFR